ncbi:hypothetical protein NDU88_003777 [Pleurodeles waltl]|uniref:Uncharacterized protein n=1 Tax=Pleurodeles waltl TaxID=8319 RepID=A0AAV7QGE0_PLEWA|nr:hypothetical protein NDU88_003777 [Pleurodeles waltl]
MFLFFTKFGKDPKKGVDRAWSNCQDRLLDLVGPLTRIFDLAEEAKMEGSQVDPETLSNWAQRAICMLGNANSYISQERRKSLLLRIDPKISTLASEAEGLNADGLLFGDSFIKEMGKYVSTFNSLDKAHYSMKRIFSNRVFGLFRSGRNRSYRAKGEHLAGKNFQFWPSSSRRQTGFVFKRLVVDNFRPLELYQTPFQPFLPRPLRFSHDQSRLIQDEIQGLLSKQAIEEVHALEKGFRDIEPQSASIWVHLLEDVWPREAISCVIMSCILNVDVYLVEV